MVPTGKSLHSLLFVLATVSQACAPQDGGQVGEETSRCEAVTSEQLSVDELSALGFRVSEILLFAEGEQQSELFWADGTATALALTMSFDNQASFQDREWISVPNGGPEPALDCVDVVSIGMQVHLQSGDGALSEDLFAELEATSASEAQLLSAPLDSAGALELATRFAPSGDFETFSASINLVTRPSGIAGSIVGQAQPPDGAGDDGTVSTTSFEIASFGNP